MNGKKNPRYRYNKSSIFQNSTSGIGNRVTGHKIDAEKREKKDPNTRVYFKTKVKKGQNTQRN